MLDDELCSGILRRNARGRIALSVDALPVILPVNYELAGEDIIMCVVLDDRHLTALDHTVVAFEVDEIDPITGAGLSVMVQGLARDVGICDRPTGSAESGRQLPTPAHPTVSLAISTLDSRTWPPCEHGPGR